MTGKRGKWQTLNGFKMVSKYSTPSSSCSSKNGVIQDSNESTHTETKLRKVKTKSDSCKNRLTM